MNIFYCFSAFFNEYVELDEIESRHIIKVLRKREGEEILIFDGRGNLFNARIESVEKKTITAYPFEVIKRKEKNTPQLHIAIALPKNIERFEWFAEKATELGVAEITPLLCEHSERKELRLERIEKILISACKQSLRLTIPKLNSLTKFEKFISADSSSHKFIAYCSEHTIHLKDAYKSGKDAALLIGPEGDFSKEEIMLADSFAFKAVSLGKNRLRLETAGIFAAGIFNLANQT